MSRMLPRLAFLTVPVLLLGCFSTHLIDEQQKDELQRLVRSAHHSLPLVVTHPDGDSSHGYQFMLGILPLTRIFTDTISETVVGKLQLHAGRAAVGLPSYSPSISELPRLEVVISSVSINGYDLVIFRRPSAHITLRGALLTHNGTRRSCEVSGEDSRTTRFAFSSELNQVLATAADSAAEKLLTCLGLISSGHSIDISNTISREEMN